MLPQLPLSISTNPSNSKHKHRDKGQHLSR